MGNQAIYKYSGGGSQRTNVDVVDLMRTQVVRQRQTCRETGAQSAGPLQP